MPYRDYKNTIRRAQNPDKKRNMKKPRLKNKIYIMILIPLIIAVLGYTKYGQSKPPVHIVEKKIKTSEPKKRHKREWKYIVIHHSGHEIGDIKRYSLYQEKKFHNNGFLYHFLIGNGIGSGTPDGKIEIADRWKYQESGGHVVKKADKFNQWGIGICLVGNFNRHEPTLLQLNTLFKLVKWLMKEYDIPSQNILTHHEVNQTACPGKYFPEKDFKNKIIQYFNRDIPEIKLPDKHVKKTDKK